MINKIFGLLLASFLVLGCEEQPKDAKANLPDSNGRINNVSVVIDHALWEGKIGEEIRSVLAATVDGLTHQEPLFTMNQIPPSAFDGFVRSNRTFLKIGKSAQAYFEIVQDTFARPQTGVFVYAPTQEELIKLLDNNKDAIVSSLKKTELKEQQNRIAKSLKPDQVIREKLGVSLNFPTAYRYAKQEDNFFWIRKDIPKGTMEILLYEVPFHTIEKDTNIVGNIIKMRDSIGKQHIPGPREGSYLVTEDAYAPYLFETQIDGKFAYESRGVWEVKNAFMAGPFINFAVKDEKNKRYVILEGFVFRPSTNKRDHVFELEAILRSAKIN